MKFFNKHRQAFGVLWLATIISFILTLDPYSKGDITYSNFLVILFLSNILLGVVFFIAFFVKNHQKSKVNKFFHYAPIIALLYVVIYSTSFTVNGIGLIAGISKQNQLSEIKKLDVPLEKISLEQSIFDEINKVRKEDGLTVLNKNDALVQSAADRAEYIIKNNSWESKPKDGKDFKYYIELNGYKHNRAAESLASGYYNAQQIVNALVSDQLNKENVYNQYFDDIGIAVKDGTLNGSSTKIIVIHFGEKLIQQTSNEVQNTNTDPIVSCTSSYPNCNGSSIKLPRSQCSQITCCQVGSTWSLYPNKESCIQAQNSGQTQQTVQQTTQKSTVNNTYCWNNAYGYGYYTTSGDQCNADNAKSTGNKICMDTQKIKANTCSSACQTASDQAKQACSGLSSYPIDYYGECLNGSGGVSDQYASCLSKCTDQYTQDIKQCN